MGKGKKSKPAAYSSKSSGASNGLDLKKSKINKFTTEDAFGGDEDEFHENRDLISFNENSNGQKDLGDISDEDEIYALNLPEVNSDEEEEIDEEDYEEEEEDEDEYSNLPTAKPTAAEPLGRFAKVSNPEQDIISNGSDSDKEDEAGSESEEETWAANSYHATRKAPGEADSSDDEALEMEVNEARRLQKKARDLLGVDDFGLGTGLEEEGVEEMRQGERKKGRLEDLTSKITVDGLVEEEAGIVEKTKFNSSEEAIAFLLKNNPETLALLDDFTDSAEKIQMVEKNLVIVRAGDEDGKEHPALAIMELEHQALSTYLPTLAFYFTLLLSPASSQTPDLKDKVLLRLSSLRSALATMEELDLTSAQLGDSEDDEDDDEDDDDEMGSEEEDSGILASDLWDLGGGEEEIDSEVSDELDSDEDDDEEDEDMNDLHALTLEELAELEAYKSQSNSMMEEMDYDSEEEEAETNEMLSGLSDAELEELIKDMQGDADAEGLIAKVREIQLMKKNGGKVSTNGGEKKKEKKKEKKVVKEVKKKSKTPLEILQSIPALAPSTSTRPKLPLPSSSKSKKSKKLTNDDYLEPTLLSYTDSTDKASKKHTLRFHVSQIHQKSLKRESGGKERISGDEDLPRISKEAQRREVLKRQEHGTTKGSKEGRALDGEDYTEGDKRDAEGVRGGKRGEVEEEMDGEDYYDLVKSGKEESRKVKKAKYEDDRSAEKAELDALGDESAAGPRGATSKMLKNKGLIPKRAKINRNSRVKKRVQYEKAKKKVASMKSIYKGGQSTLGHGEYSGEKSGIGSGKVVKSVRLGGK